MKKILSMLLAVVMLFGLFTIPAAAEEVPVYEQFGYASEEEFMEYEFWYMSERGITYEYVVEFIEAHYAEILENPQIALDFWDITAEDLESNIVAGFWESEEDFYLHIALEMTYSDAYDFVPPLSVQLEGEKVIFPDAAPEITDGRTMVPFRAIAEEMGFTVSFDNGAIVGSDGETSVAFIVGETACVVKKVSGEETVTMDTAPYIKEDRTYVPVRFFAEAMGMTVAWDEDYQVAVIYDKEAWIQKIDEEFTVYNELFEISKTAQEVPEDFEMMLSMGMTITRISSLDGNTTYPVEFETTFIKEGNKIQGTMLLDFFEIIKLAAEESGVSEEEMSATLMGMEQYLKDIEAELILNLDEGKIYIYCEALNYYLALQGRFSVNDVKKGWLVAELPDMSAFTEEFGAIFGDLMKEAASVDTVGELLMLIAAPEKQYNASKGLEDLMEGVELFKTLYGNDVFTKKGNEYVATWEYDLSEIMPDDEYYYDGGYFKGNMKYNSKTQAVSMDMEIRMNEYDGDTLMKIKAEGKGNDVKMTMIVHEENEVIVEVEAETKMTDVKKSPLSAPPEGSIIIDMNEL